LVHGLDHGTLSDFGIYILYHQIRLAVIWPPLLWHFLAFFGRESHLVLLHE